MALPYSPTRAHDFAVVAAQVVPVLLVAAFAVPALRAPRAEHAPSALRDLLLGAILLGVALVTEMLALFGVVYGLGHADTGLLLLCLFVTAIFALQRMIAPLVRAYSEDRRLPTSRLWWLLGCVTLVVSLVTIFGLSWAEQRG